MTVTLALNSDFDTPSRAMCRYHRVKVTVAPDRTPTIVGNWKNVKSYILDVNGDDYQELEDILMLNNRLDLLNVNEGKVIKVTLKEVKQVIGEAVKEHALREAKSTADKILAEKDGFLKGLARKVGMSDPSQDVDDSKKVEKTLDKSISTASSTANEFQASSLRTSREINRFHDTVKDVMDKVSSMSDTLGPEKAKQYHSKMIQLARDFYSLLKNESERIDSYLKTLGSDLEDKGVKKSVAYNNQTGLKQKQPGFKPKRPGDVAEPDDDFLKSVGVKKKPYRDDTTAVFNHDDPEQVKDFIRGKSKVRA
jgi:hypothetical protein